MCNKLRNWVYAPLELVHVMMDINCLPSLWCSYINPGHTSEHLPACSRLATVQIYIVAVGQPLLQIMVQLSQDLLGTVL